MPTPYAHPYRLRQAFFATIHVARSPQVPETEMEFALQAKVIGRGLPQQLEVQLKVDTAKEKPINISLFLIGYFELVDRIAVPSQDEINQYVEDVGLPVMWAYVDQMARVLTAQMGMAPICLQAPAQFSGTVPQQDQSP